LPSARVTRAATCAGASPGATPTPSPSPAPPAARSAAASGADEQRPLADLGGDPAQQAGRRLVHGVRVLEHQGRGGHEVGAQQLHDEEFEALAPEARLELVILTGGGHGDVDHAGQQREERLHLGGQIAHCVAQHAGGDLVGSVLG